MKLTRSHVVTALLAAQGLIEPPRAPAVKADVLAAIRRMHVLQIDSISVVNRSPYLVLFNRIGAYPMTWLTDLLAERQLFEYWSHAACFLPIEDYPSYRPGMHRRRAEHFPNGEWTSRHLSYDVIQGVLAHIRENGEVRSSDFERTDGQKGTWWNWKAEKLALEYLFTFGEVMVARREGFQRVYDLQERIHPWDDAQTPPIKASYRTWIEKTARALGAAPAAWYADYFRISKAAAANALRELVQDGVVVEVDVEGEAVPYYAHRDSKPQLEQIADGVVIPSRTLLFSPFDPVVWDRTRLKSLFGMDYKIEVYTPEPKRKYGYFTLPILHDGQMVGRLDPKAHRAEGRFEVRSIHLEPGVAIDDGLVHGLAHAIREFADWHATPQVEIGRSDPAPLADALRGTGIV